MQDWWLNGLKNKELGKKTVQVISWKRYLDL